MKEMSEKLIGLIDTVYICVHSTHITSSDTQSEEPTVTATQYTHSHYTAYLRLALGLFGVCFTIHIL